MSNLMFHRLSVLSCLLAITILSCTSEEAKSTIGNTKVTQNERTTSVNLFTKVDSKHSGVEFKNNVIESTSRNSMFYDYFLNGGGVAIGDINNDGLSDLYFTGNDVSNRLYLNKGNMVFENITNTALPKLDGWATGVNMVDINQDGFLDIFVCRSGITEDKDLLTNKLYLNNKDLTFRDVSTEYGLDIPNNSIHSSFFDYDSDGDLDLLVANHINYNGDIKYIFENNNKSHNSRKTFRTTLFENINNQFFDVSQQAGISRESTTLGLATIDLNDDGLLDIYLSNDYEIPDYYFINNGDKTFTEVSKEKIGHTSFYSMGMDVADINNDNILDFVAVDMTPSDHVRNKTLMASMDSKKFNFLYDQQGMTRAYMFNTLQIGRGNGNFSEIGNYMGMAQTEWSWAPLVADFDNDGMKDLYITNGYLHDTKDNDFKLKIAEYKKSHGNNWNEDVFNYFKSILKSTPVDNKIYRNNGVTFDDVTSDWSNLAPTFSNGAAYGDLDNDGDLDIVINNLSQEATILKNNSKANHYLQIGLVDKTSKNTATNAKVFVSSKDRIQRGDYTFSRGYQSSVQHRLHFGLGDTDRIDSVTIIWSDGTEEKFNKIDIDAFQTLTRGEGSPSNLFSSEDNTAPLFKNQSLSNTIHKEHKYNDFGKEVLLPHKYSDLGPALASGDINGDGLEDLFVGGSNICEPYILINNGNTLIRKDFSAILSDKKYEDLGAHFFDINNDGNLDLYVASGGGGEIESFPRLTQDRLYINDGNGNLINATKALPKIESSTKAIVSLDIDKDGDMDLVVGGRNTPGKYPTPARSYLLINENGTLKDRGITELEDFPGMVTDMEVVDFNNDGWQDLIVVGEWSAPKIYVNKNGKLTKAAMPSLEKHVGWWQSISQSDLDNDGDMDFILGNVGKNTKFHPSQNKPLGILAADFDATGTLDIVLTKKYHGKTVPVRGKECSTEQMPMLKDKFKTYSAFANSSVEEILGESNINRAYHQSATDFGSYILENQGNMSFKLKILPPEAQWFPINDIAIEDFDNDGNSDIFLVGNKINAEPETPSYDAGHGLLLLNKGNLNFTPIADLNMSGIDAKFDSRAVSTLRTNKGNKMIVVANNNGPVQCFIQK